MRPMVLALVTAALLTGCEDFVTVQIALDPVAIDRDFAIGELPPDVCPSVTRELEPMRALAGTATLEPIAAECVLTIELDDAVLLERDAVLAVREQLAGADTTALLGIVVDVEEAELMGPGGAAIGPAALHTIEGRIDGVAVVPPTAPGAALAATRVLLPRSTVDELLAAIDEGREARADLTLRLAFAGPAAVPSEARFHLALQPILLVDAVRAAL